MPGLLGLTVSNSFYWSYSNLSLTEVEWLGRHTKYKSLLSRVDSRYPKTFGESEVFLSPTPSSKLSSTTRPEPRKKRQCEGISRILHVEFVEIVHGTSSPLRTSSHEELTAGTNVKVYPVPRRRVPLARLLSLRLLNRQNLRFKEWKKAGPVRLQHYRVQQLPRPIRRESNAVSHLLLTSNNLQESSLNYLLILEILLPHPKRFSNRRPRCHRCELTTCSN